MADVITKNVKVAEGNELLVNNLRRKPNSKKMYRAVWIEDWEGSEICCLFKEEQLRKNKEIKLKGFTVQKGHVYCIDSGSRKSVLLSMVRWDSEELVTLKLSYGVYIEALIRASKNEEDIPKKGFLTDLMD